jgi:TP53 regulating kinase-like protein
MKLIGNGAEAKIYLDEKEKQVVKRRIEKSYRVKEIDEVLRKRRTRKEGKILDKLGDICPNVFLVDDKKMEIVMSYVEGRLVKDVAENCDKRLRKDTMFKAGFNVGKMHGLDVAHGDLTTSNMIYDGGDVKLIDFGLGFASNKVEDKAVDIHLVRQALESKHYRYVDEMFEDFLRGYKKGNVNWKEIIERLKKVEKRGRYKRKLP